MYRKKKVRCGPLRMLPLVAICLVVAAGILLTQEKKAAQQTSTAATQVHDREQGVESFPVQVMEETVENADLNTNDSETTDEISETMEPSTSPTTVTQKAQEILNGMTLDEKVGQMFIAHCPETDGDQKAEEYHLGGYILFGRDFSEKTKDEVIQAIQSYQGAAKIPMFIGVDEEGGTVNRVSTNSNLRAVPFWSPQELYAEGGFDLIQSDPKRRTSMITRF